MNLIKIYQLQTKVTEVCIFRIIIFSMLLIKNLFSEFKSSTKNDSIRCLKCFSKVRLSKSRCLKCDNIGNNLKTVILLYNFNVFKQKLFHMIINSLKERLKRINEENSLEKNTNLDMIWNLVNFDRIRDLKSTNSQFQTITEKLKSIFDK